ncbi:hypothetical protein H5410_014413 [Solanum commersonii]|uniref:ubiquitinyl hydrolase 1 n=1 Tax=Solanum commersonii TaxID=4109 RepID=A0A9J5ZQU7_SOLCO|nr:hypothetical protein H5410_014413 [Solanum commersonii]
MEALRVAHSVEVDHLCLAHNWNVALQNERNINSGNLKSILELLSKRASSSSSLVPPSDSTPI